jgi:hypothetical protein
MSPLTPVKKINTKTLEILISSSTMSPYRKGAPVSSIAVALIVLEQIASAILGTYTG